MEITLGTRVRIINSDFAGLHHFPGEVVGPGGNPFFASWIVLLDQPYMDIRAIQVPIEHLTTEERWKIFNMEKGFEPYDRFTDALLKAKGIENNQGKVVEERVQKWSWCNDE